jgi:SAM-dependent methyltransferase
VTFEPEPSAQQELETYAEPLGASERSSPARSDSVCLLCGGSLSEVTARALYDTRFGIPAYWDVHKCGRCGLEHLHPSPSPSDLKQLYERYYNFGGEKNTRYTRLRDLFFSSALHKWWAALDGDISFYSETGAGRLLDVGCNEGRGLGVYAANGFSVEGLELNTAAAAEARKRGFVVHTELLENFRSDKPFDVIVLSNVLEHASDPAAMLRDVRRLLCPGGEIWISCPNARSAMRTLFGNRWINWHIPFHIVHFSPATLESLLRRNGFDQVSTHHISPALWVAMSGIAALFARPGKANRQLHNPALVLIFMLLARVVFFPVLWLANITGRGDCLLVTATRNSTSPNADRQP